MPEAKLSVAAAQIAPRLGDVEANLAIHEASIAEARGRRADLVVFPELSLTGYMLRDMVSTVALRLDSAELKHLKRLSQKIGIVVGLVEETRSFRFHNSAVLLDRGEIVTVHRKVYLPTYGMFDEGRYFAAGDRLQAFSARHGRFGMLICEDLWHASTSLVLAQDGADYLLVLSNGPTQGIDAREGLASQATWRDLARVIAQLQTCYVAWVNRVGFEDGINFGGGSLVVDPFGRILAAGKVLEDDLVTCDLPRSSLRRARTALPLLRDERLGVLSREVQRLLAVPAAGRGPGAS